MSDESWSFGAPAKVRPSLGRGLKKARVPEGGGPNGDGPKGNGSKAPKRADPNRSRIAFAAIGVLVLVLAAFAFFKFVGKSGSEVAATETHAINEGQDVATQSDLRNVLVAAKTSFASNGTYQGIDAATLEQSSPGLTYVAGPSTKPGEVSFTSNATAFAAAERSASGTCYYIRDVASGGTFFGKGTGDCTASEALALATAPSW